MHIYLLIVRDWFTWLWRLRSPRSAVHSWRPRRADGVGPVWVLRPENQERADGISTSLKADRPDTQEELMLQFKSKSSKRPKSQLEAVGAGGGPSYSAFLFCLGLQFNRWRPPTSGRAVCFAQSTDSNLHLLQKHPRGHTQNDVWPTVWVSCDPVRWTRKMNHHHIHHKYHKWLTL